MSEFVYFELKPELRRELGLPPHPIPVRREHQQAVFRPGGQVDFASMLGELRVFLDENPRLHGDYAHLLAMLAYLAGLAAAGGGFHEHALHLYECGLDAVPASVSLLSHHALSLHCLGRDVEARRDIEQVIALTPRDRILPVLWMILARILARDGEYARAHALLQDVSTLIPEEDGFWDLLAEMADRAGITPPAAAAAAPAALDLDLEQPAPPALWHYVLDNQTLGPVPASVLQERLARGELRPDTLVWNPALADWCSASEAGLVARRA